VLFDAGLGVTGRAVNPIARPNSFGAPPAHPLECEFTLETPIKETTNDSVTTTRSKRSRQTVREW
jgi:hypothetical protein